MASSVPGASRFAYTCRPAPFLEFRLNNQWFSKVAVWLVVGMVLFTVFKQFDTICLSG
jgi:cell division protease FtsH